MTPTEASKLINLLGLNIEPPQPGQIDNVTGPAIIDIAKRVLNLEANKSVDEYKIDLKENFVWYDHVDEMVHVRKIGETT